MSDRVLVITGTTDMFRSPTETDNTMEEVYNLTLPSKLKYAQQHGYDILSLRSFGTDNKFGFKDMDIGFLRTLRCFEMLEYYDTVMWLDADAIITNQNYTIDKFQVNSTHSFYASLDWMETNTFSTGNFIIHKGESYKELFSVFIQVAKYVIEQNIWGWEQTTMNIIYQSSNYKNNIKVLDRKYLNSVPDFMNWESDRNIVEPWTPDSFLAHLTGTPNYQRINALKTKLKDYL
jgi:hypothetical protein